MRREFTKKLKREIIGRATDASGVVRCEGCGMDLTGKKFEIDHIIAESLVPEWRKSEPLSQKDGQLLGECCHRGDDGKTKKDVKAAAKTKRLYDKANGISKPKGTVQSRNDLRGEKKRPKIDKEAIDRVARVGRRQLYGAG